MFILRLAGRCMARKLVEAAALVYILHLLPMNGGVKQCRRDKYSLAHDFISLNINPMKRRGVDALRLSGHKSGVRIAVYAESNASKPLLL